MAFKKDTKVKNNFTKITIGPRIMSVPAVSISVFAIKESSAIVAV